MDGRAISILIICSTLLGCSAGSTVLPVGSKSRFVAPTDESLQQAAEQALGDVEGAVIAIDPDTGHLRAVVNPRLAYEQSFPPGSAIKPFTLLAAWRSGLVDPETRRLCQGRYENEGFSIVCSHPNVVTPFTVDQALAWSCNDYFSHLGERLSEGSFNGLLSEFGFGHRTGLNATENPGRLKSAEWRVANALGESDDLLVTPIQLMAAYSTLINGGRLIRPSLFDDGTAGERGAARINIPAQYRMQLLKGMRGTVVYGTASKAGLARLSPQVFGKTGTSTSSNGFRSSGWFVGFTANDDTAKLGVLVFIRRGNGAKAATIAAGVFECALAGRGCGVLPAIAQRPAIAQFMDASMRGRSSVKVRSISKGVTRQLPLEDYLVGVLSGEAGTENQIEALKAQAVVSRTFALRNAGRHSDEGYDFCSTTHCQRFVAAGQRNAAKRAVASTTGMALVDRRGLPIDAFFHAACGGRTAGIEALWGVRPAPEYLRGVRDDYCTAMPHRNWTQTISSESLRQALQSDQRSAIGARLRTIKVTRRDASGRAQHVVIEGERRVELSGWELKMIVGRHLGWQMIKSSLFEVSRSGENFVFRGGGFGHGLGLCQEGAHGAARRGMRFNRILEHYFPETRLVAEDIAETPRTIDTDRFQFSSVVNSRPGDTQSSDILSSEHFRLRVIRGPLNSSPQGALRILESALQDIASRLDKAGVPYSNGRPIGIVIHASTSSYVAATGLSGWSAGATRGDSIQLQPLEILRKRRIFETTLRHELGHVVIERIGEGHTPRWLAEGLAIHFAGDALPDAGRSPRLSPAEIDDRLAKPQSHREMRMLYAQAYREVRNLIHLKGEASVWKMANAKYREDRADERRI